MRNITIAILESMYVNAANMWQWDYGQILRIQGKNIPKAVEVHFSLNEKGGDSITRIGTTIDGITDVPIPDTLLENNGAAQDYIIYAFVYLEDGESGNTEYKIRIPVKSRPKPEIPGTPEEPELFRETVKAVNAAADRAEVSEKNAKTSEEEAGKYATSASSSAEEAKKTKEDAIKEVAEKKREAISAIEEQEKSSANSITNHTDGEIQRIQNQVTESETELEQTIKDASIGKTALDGSINAAGESKDDLDKSIRSATTAKTELDTSTEGVGKAKTALDGSIKTAGEKQTALDITVKAADKLDTSLKEQITTGTQLQKDLVASGKKSVQDIQDAGSEQLDEMQTVAEEFEADREQITVNKKNIDSLGKSIEILDNKKITKFYANNQGETYLADSDNGKIMDMMIYGQSEQKQYRGKNLLPTTMYSNNIVRNGITFINNRDGSVTASGTATDVAYFVLWGYNVLDDKGVLPGIKPGDTIYVSDCLLQQTNSKEIISTISNRSTQFKASTTTMYVAIRVDKGATVNKTYYPQIELGSEFTGYEPYVGGQPSPSPDYPQEIKTVVNPTIKLSNEDGTVSQSVTLPYTLNAIPVSSGGNVTIDGQQYIADYVDVERGKVVRMCKKKAVPNNYDWNLQKQSGGYKIGYLTSIFTDMGTTQFDSNKKAISNLGDSSKTWSNNFGFGKSGVFWINPYTNNGELTANDINSFLTEHPMEVTYLLKTPIEEELTTESSTGIKRTFHLLSSNKHHSWLRTVIWIHSF